MYIKTKKRKVGDSNNKMTKKDYENNFRKIEPKTLRRKMGAVYYFLFYKFLKLRRISINNEPFFKLPLKKSLDIPKKTIPCKKDSQVNHCPLHKNTKWVCP